MKGFFKKLALMAITGSLASDITTAQDTANTNTFEGKKVVIVYYSHSGETYNPNGNIYLEKGNTEIIAEKIQKSIEGSKIVKLGVKEKYPTEYDIIFVGTPVWWGKMSLPVEAFLKSEECKGKIIIPFITHERSGESGIGESMKDISGCERVLKSLVIKGSEVNEGTTDETIKTFLVGVNF